MHFPWQDPTQSPCEPFISIFFLEHHRWVLSGKAIINLIKQQGEALRAHLLTYSKWRLVTPEIPKLSFVPFRHNEW